MVRACTLRDEAIRIQMNRELIDYVYLDENVVLAIHEHNIFVDSSG